MPDVHVPKIEGHGRGKTALRIVLEVTLIGVGVFLGLLGEQWRENAHQRELAKASLRRFRAEIIENRSSVAAVADYHAALRKELQPVFDGHEGASLNGIHFQGVEPATFDRSAWDLAIATQSLAYIDPDLALSLANIYNAQNRIADLTRGVLQAAYASPPVNDSNSMTFFGSVLIYYGDMIVQEPRLLAMYDAVLPKIDAALGEKTSR